MKISNFAAGTKSRSLTQQRSAELTAKILILMYTKNFNTTSFSMYSINKPQFLVICGRDKLEREFLREVRSYLHARDYYLFKIRKCFFITEKAEIDLIREIPNLLLNKYIKTKNAEIEKEFALEEQHEFGLGHIDNQNYDQQ